MHEQGEYLLEELRNFRVNDPNMGTLSEILFTASESGIIEGISAKDAVLIYKIVRFAKSYNNEPLEDGMRM